VNGGASEELRASPPLAQIEVADGGDVRVVVVRGELDMSNVEALREAAFALPNAALGIVLDLSATTFIDSATVGLLFELQGGLARRRQALRVVCEPGSTAGRLLELVSFDHDALSERERAGAVAAIRRELSPRE
jgi:anti-anti-sigma factor